MRIKAGWTVEETIAALSDEQRDEVAAVESTRAAEDEAIREVLNRTRKAVRRALTAGVPAHVLASRLNVSRARVYQMRDEAIAYEAEVERAKDAEKAAARAEVSA